MKLTPFGSNPEWDGTRTESGVWGETFVDQNANRVWDQGEPFEDDPANSQLDPSSKDKYDGIYLAGFGNRRLATGMHDDLWARTIVLDDGRTRFAIVAVDFLGYYSDSPFYGIRHVRRLIGDKTGIQEILIASTHNHEGPDTIGVWGNGPLSDGKYPRYLRFVDRQIAKSILQAVAALEPVRVRLGRTDPVLSPSLAGMQTRTRGRPPQVFDDELRVMQFVARRGSPGNRTIATLINWNTHPESMEDKNTDLTSDFPHAVRSTVESKYGGIALYISGAIGAVEIVGDSNTKSTDRVVFDGRRFPLGASNRPAFTFDRTEAIGRDVGKAASEAIDRGQMSSTERLDLKKADLYGPMDNPAYALLVKAGVLDTIAVSRDSGSLVFETAIYSINIGDAQIVTTPGELFPELFLGVARLRRTDCAAADNGSAAEPGIKDAMSGKFRFIFGLCPDELGYIVPGYDWQREPFDQLKMSMPQSPDACKAQGVPNHYHETNSASSVMAQASTCVTVALLKGRLPADRACSTAGQYSSYVRSLK